MDKHTICLLNDSFPPIIDGVANAVVNYAENIEKHHGHAVVVTPAVPGADDSGFPFPVVRYPSIDMTKLVGYHAGFPFSEKTMKTLMEYPFDLIHCHCPVTSAVLARELRSRIPYVLALVGLADKGNRYPDELSGGEQQRVAIARALVNNPSTIVADEPTGNLDPARSLEIMTLLERINALGTTVIVVTHERGLVNHFNKRVIYLESGRVAGDATGTYEGVAQQ